MIWWEDELKKRFPENKIDDLSDFDVTPDMTFYIAVNGFTGDFGSGEFEKFSESDHVYYMVVNISGDEGMAYLDFLKYVKGSKGRNLIVSAEPFLKEHEKFKAAGIDFIKRMKLKLQYFESSSYDESPQPSPDPIQAKEDSANRPTEIHYAGDYQIRYRILSKADENNPAILQKLGEIFRRYEKQIGIDLQFQDFATELANLPGNYARPKGAIILAEVIHDSSASFANPPNSRALPQIAGCVALRSFEGSAAERQAGRFNISKDRICEMKRLYVEPAFTGLEIGGELARRIIMEAQKQGYKYMRLDTLSTMGKAQRLYESLGFYDIEPYIYNPHPHVRYMELKL